MTDSDQTQDSTWKQKIAGGFDLILLFGRGIDPFEKGGRRAALRSLWIPAAMFPLGMISAYLYPPEGLEKQPMSKVMIITASSGVLMFLAGVALLWLFASVMKRQDRFWVVLQAGNWVGIPMSIIGLPFLIAAIMNLWPREQMDHVLMAFTYYGVLVSACITFRGLKIGWEWAGFFACMSIFVSQQIWNLLFWLNDVPIKWDL
jgi:hypothetical protein